MGVSISEFRGEYYFLSNFYSAPVTYNGMCFENNEAAFQAAKCPERMTEFCRLNPSEAKRLGRRVKLRGDWEAVKDTVMYEICKAKFSQNPDLADQLVATKDAELIEGNTWGDRIWGVCDGVGENRHSHRPHHPHRERTFSCIPYNDFLYGNGISAIQSERY